MLKVLLSISFLFMSTFVNAEESYVFEAKGAFAKELKALVEKYSKEGKIDAKVYKKDDTIVNTILGRNRVDLNGQNVYTKKCASCHGANGEVSAGAGSRVIKNLSKDDYISSVTAYRIDEHHGGAMKMLMYDIAIGISDDEIEATYNYLHGMNTHKTNNLKTQSSDELESNYLK